ncbi:DNA repair protein RadC [Flavobacteriaceae bacterium]|jgi:DNA repair protein RadC|nr:DNA repair protein RadC [Flavobacteriaceae bacterium]MDB2586840.1 DNA repair protein RadC [Flavobacteriaceae bacterium]
MIRPQDSIWQEGFESLSTSELIALLIKGNAPHWHAELLGAQLMAKVGQNLATLERTSLAELTAIKGIGRAKALTILAAFELGRRRRQDSRRLTQKMESSRCVYEFMRPSLGHLDHEEFWVLFLNAAHGIEGISQLSKGGVTSTVVDLRLLIKKALDYRAVAMILIHNHPSGAVAPSESDKKLTRRITQAAQQMDLRVLDHLIVAEKDYFSFADAQLI